MARSQRDFKKIESLKWTQSGLQPYGNSNEIFEKYWVFKVDLNHLIWCRLCAKQSVVKCEVYATRESAHDPVPYLMNSTELLNCWKILFACLLCYTFVVLSIWSIEIILPIVLFLWKIFWDVLKIQDWQCVPMSWMHSS